MFGLGFQELMVVGIIAILLFGKRLPEVAKTLGGSYKEFRKGLAEFHSAIDLNDTSYTSTRSSYKAPASTYRAYDDYDQATAPKFEPPPAEPQPSASREDSTSVS